MHVVVLGAGYAGIRLVQQLETRLPESVQLTLVDQDDSHLIQHLLHRVLRDPELVDRLTIPLADCVSRTTIHQSRVKSIDKERGTITMEDSTLAYDLCAICLGAQTNFRGRSGIKRYATPLKRITHATEIREQFSEVCAAGGRVIVCGAGLSGIQVAGELGAISNSIDGDSKPQIILIEQESAIAPTFSTQFQSTIYDELEKLGVEIRTNTTVTGATAKAIVFADESSVSYGQLIWTGGIRGQDAVSGERPVVRSDLRLNDRTFGLGDAVRVIDSHGNAVPASAQTALEQASVTATNIERLVEHLDSGNGFEPRLNQYRYNPTGWVVTVGDEMVAQVGSTVLRGQPARLLKLSVGTSYINSVAGVNRAIEYVRESF